MLPLQNQINIEIMRNTPIERKLIDETIADFHITDFAKATIREVKAIAANAETASGVEFIKMEMGVPGLPLCRGRKGRSGSFAEWHRQPLSGYKRTSRLEAGSITFYQSLYQCRCGPRRLRTSYRLHARNFCFIPHVQPVR